jgi:hypothetical protein
MLKNALIILIWVLLLMPVPRALADPAIPFGPGEKIRLDVAWCNIPVGHALLEVLPMDEVGGEPAFHFRMNARTNKFADIFFKVRDKVDSYTDAGMNRSLRYENRQREGDYHRDIVVEFDWSGFTARYFNRDEPEKPVQIMPGTFDPLSVFYAFRVMEFPEDGRLLCPVTDGKRSMLGKASIVSRQVVETPAGTFDTYLVEPDLEHIGGVFKKSPRAKLQIWVTADKRRIPVMIKSKVKIGSFTAQLASYTTGR